MIGPSQPFPNDAKIEGSRLAFAIMRKYSEEEARTLFQEDGNSTEDNDPIVIDKAVVAAATENKYQRKKYNSTDNKRSTSTRRWTKTRDTRRELKSSSYTPWKYRENTYCSICGSEGHEAREDGCFATGRFLRMIKNLDQQLYRRIKDKYRDLVDTIDKKLQDSIDYKKTKRRERNAKVTYMELAEAAIDNELDEEEARQVCINCAYTIFPALEEENESNSDEDYADASSS